MGLEEHIVITPPERLSALRGTAVTAAHPGYSIHLRAV